MARGTREGGLRALSICVQAKVSLTTNPGLPDREEGVWGLPTQRHCSLPHPDSRDLGASPVDEGKAAGSSWYLPATQSTVALTTHFQKGRGPALSVGGAGPAFRLPKHRAGFSARVAGAGPLPTTGTAIPESSSLGAPRAWGHAHHAETFWYTLWPVWTSSRSSGGPRPDLVGAWASVSQKTGGRTSAEGCLGQQPCERSRRWGWG